MTDRDQIRREIATPINQSTSSEENRSRALGALDALLAELEQAERLVEAVRDFPLWLLEQDDTPEEAYKAVTRLREALTQYEATQT